MGSVCVYGTRNGTAYGSGRNAGGLGTGFGYVSTETRPIRYNET